MDRSGSIEALGWVFDASPDLVVAIDRDGRVVFANRAARARWSLGALVTDGFPDDARAEVDAARARALTGAVARFGWGDRGPGGVRAWFACTISPIHETDAGAAIIGALCVSSETTELKRVEERLRRTEQLMVDTQGVAHLGTWDWDVSEPHAIWSEELYRIYGLTPATYTPSYEAYLTMVHPDDRQRVMDATTRVFQEHVPYSHDERIFRPDGSIRYLHTWAYPVVDDGGTLRRLVGVCQDITDRKLAEAQVLQMNVELESRVAERTRTIENSMRDLEAFNSMVSHDLRAPLQVIQLNGEMIRRKLPGLAADVVEHLDRIHRSVDQMTALVEDLLSLARVGHTTLDRVEVDLSTLARDVLAELADRAPERRVATAIEPGLRGRGDAGLIRAMMQNLLENAWKYSARTPDARIEVGGFERDDARGCFVRDNGVGFEMKDAHRLYAPFARLHAATEFAGSGIGLATVQRILERHGGRIWAESAPDAGATFYFVLPD